MSRSPRSDGGPPSRGRLEGSVLPIASLSGPDRAAMFTLMERYFAGIARGVFEADLAEKEWAVLLRDPAGEIRGFSTLMRMSAEVDGERIVAFFSGDTIVDRASWGQQELPRLWGRHVFALAEEITGARAFWFLISGGHKTYRYLPLFFRAFFPSADRPAPRNARRILEALATAKFPDEFDPERGVVRLAARLRPGVADPAPREREDPDVAFFLRANPGHVDGDELACLTEIDVDNLTPAGRRMIGLR